MARAVRVLVAVIASTAAAAAAADHVRVVLDISQSMRQNDQRRLAVLSTTLLYDLANPNLSLGDTFEVYPFYDNWVWRDPSEAPPAEVGPPIRPAAKARTKFMREIQALRYDARMTYFYPGLKRAIDELSAIPAGVHDVRAIVLITDGLPESHMVDHERQLIRDELVPMLEGNNLRLYVLAFGSQAFQNQDFFAGMVKTASGTSLGESFVDPDGSGLLTNMTRIFGRSFGFDVDAARQLPIAQLDLEGGTTPDRVAVVVYSAQGQRVPRLQLAAPPGAVVNAPTGVRGARETDASYAVRWVLSPGKGLHGFETDALRGSVAVLRPTRLLLEVRPAPPWQQTARTMAQTPFPLQILVKPPAGARGDPGPVDLSFRTNGERVRDPETGQSGYAWQGDLGSPPAGLGTTDPEGRVYDIVAEFPENPPPEQEFYSGYLEAEARRGEAVVGSLAGPRAHRIDVYPLLSIVPSPSLGDAIAGGSGSRQRALSSRDLGCTKFSLALGAGELPHPGRPRYTVRAVLDSTVRLEGALREASFLLDGLPVTPDRQPGSRPGAWYSGRDLSADELLGEHEVCIQVGRPAAGTLGQPNSLPVQFTLMESPYDDFRVVEPFTFKVEIAPPGFLERWRALLLMALLALMLLGALWYLRNRPDLPGDLHYSMARGHEPAVLRPMNLRREALAARLLGLVAGRPIVAEGDDNPLGSLRPVSDELFRFRPARNVRVQPLDPGEDLTVRRGQTTLEVHNTYRLTRDGVDYLFRVEYR